MGLLEKTGFDNLTLHDDSSYDVLNSACPTRKIKKNPSPRCVVYGHEKDVFIPHVKPKSLGHSHSLPHGQYVPVLTAMCIVVRPPRRFIAQKSLQGIVVVNPTLGHVVIPCLHIDAPVLAPADIVVPRLVTHCNHSSDSGQS